MTQEELEIKLFDLRQNTPLTLHETDTIDNLTRAVHEIPLLFKIRKTWNTQRSSYSLKHDLEYFRKKNKLYGNAYITGSLFTIAMIELGYDKRQIQNDPNYYFNVKILKNYIN
jgi:hypothetical protein